jgi:thiol:disulfide interchange protein/DsbC/DsbD-like thiol-disulfide interchange protein
MPRAMVRTNRLLLLLGFCLCAAAGSARAQAAGELLALPAGARAEGAFDRGEPRVVARLLVHPDDAAGSQAPRLGVHFELDPGWHLYWRDPGESGLATQLRWDVPGASVEPVAWPAPSAFTESEGLFTTYGYAGQVLLATRARFAEGSTQPRVARVSVDLLVCEVECIPAKLALEHPLDVAAGDDAERALFADAARRVPLAPEALGIGLALSADLGARTDASGFVASLDVRPCRDEPRCARLSPDAHALFSDGRGGITLERIDAEPDGAGGFRLALAGSALSATDPRLTGVLALVDADGRRQTVELDLPLRAAPAAHASGASSLAQALALALLGGLILNLMPCVLPVLAFKAVAIAELAHRRRREALAHGLAYLAGVLASLAALAAVVVALRSAGTAVGWGFQFQEPLFVAAVASVLVVFALNLFGVFEIGVDTGRLASIGAQAVGARRSFFDGLLAVVLATPCSAPFLGTAVGFAFASDAPVIFAIFLAVGVGLALPFVLVSAIPGGARWLPRSGPWMLKLRAGLGFVLLATVVWLLWIIGRGAGSDAMTSLLAWLLALGFASWLYATLRESSALAFRSGAALAFGLLLVAGAGVVSVEREANPSDPATRDADAPRPYEDAAVTEELRAGRPVFVYFTADWCLTCKVNERVVLDDDAVRAALADFAVFEADWTRRDERIRAALARFGRSGVPLYLLYSPGGESAPVRLPELLSKPLFLEALRVAAGADSRVREVTVSPAQKPMS